MSLLRPFRDARYDLLARIGAGAGGEAFRAVMNTLERCDAQLAAVATFFDELGECHVRLPIASGAANDDALELAA